MKKFSVNCDFGGQNSPFAIYIGSPEGAHHSLHFQADWLSKNRGGALPGSVMESVSKLYDIASKYNVSAEELIVYALGAAHQEMEEDNEEVNASDASAGIATTKDVDNEDYDHALDAQDEVFSSAEEFIGKNQEKEDEILDEEYLHFLLSEDLDDEKK